MKKSAVVVIVALAIFLVGALAEKEMGIVSRVTLFFDNVGTAEIPAMREFVFKEHFTNYPGIWIKMDGPWTPQFGGKDFQQFVEMTEKPVNASVLGHKTIGPLGTSFAEVMKELGGESKVATTFSQIYYLIEKQKNDKDGPLLVCPFINNTRHNKNLFFVKSPRGVVYPVSVSATFHEGESKIDWSVYVEFYGEHQRLIDMEGIRFKFEELISGDVVFYPN